MKFAKNIIFSIFIRKKLLVIFLKYDKIITGVQNGHKKTGDIFSWDMGMNFIPVLAFAIIFYSFIGRELNYDGCY